SALSSSMPLMLGITRSVMTTEGRKAVTFSRASAPSAAASAVNPHARTSSVRPLRVAGSFSTIRTRSATCDTSATFFNLSSLIEPSTTIPPVTEPVTRPPRPTWPAWVEILLCSGYPTQILVGQLLVAVGINPLLPNGSLSSTFVFLLSMADTVLLVGMILAFLLRRGERPAEVFFGGRPALGEIRAGILSVPFVIGVMVALMLVVRRFVPALHNVPDNPLEGLMGTGVSLWTFLAVVIVAGGVREELQRAFLLHRFRGDLGQPWMGLFITSLAFGTR